MTPTPLIQVENVHKAFGPFPILRGVSLTVAAGEVLAVIGASGCGKSTLLRIISGLETPDQGQVTLGDPNFTLVFQNAALFDSMTVFENVAFALRERPDMPGDKLGNWRELSEGEIRRQVLEKLRLVGLEGMEEKYPNELSGGMQKRVSFARAIMGNPRIILYDEPTAGLDPVASTILEDYILQLRNELGAASVVVTHQHSTIFRTADRVCMLQAGEVYWVGTLEALRQTEDPTLRPFVHSGVAAGQRG